MELVSYTSYHSSAHWTVYTSFIYTFTFDFQLEELDSQFGQEEAKVEEGDEVCMKDEEEPEKGVFFDGMETHFSQTATY